MSKATPLLSKEDTNQVHPLQAILLCEPWGEEKRWGPLVRRQTDDDDEEEDEQEQGSSRRVKGENRPWCLLPLLDIPLLAWSLECLAASGVQEIFIFVNNGVEEVRSWLATSIYTQSHYPLSIILRPTTAQTPGDVMREVDSLQILAPADFLVVQAGYVGNVDLKLRVEQFTERRKREGVLAMSCVVAPRMNPTTTKSVVHMLSLDHQLLHYEEATVYPRRKQAKLPREALDGGKEMTVRSDLESIGVQICSVEVPPLFTENFDYQFFYPGFVNGILTSDLLGKTICCTVLGEEVETTEKSVTSSRAVEWAAVVGNTKSYDMISKSLLSRKAFPLAPDESMPNAIDRYEARRGRVYLGKDLDLSRTASIASTSLLGHSISVGPQSVVTRSVISSSSRIGASCTITNSYIFEGAQIGDGCTIVDSIIGEQVIVGERSRIEGGSLIGARVKIGSTARLSGKRVGIEPYSEDVEEEEEEDDSSLGEGAIGFFWPSELMANNEYDDDDDEDALDPRNYSISKLGAKFSTLHVSSSTSSLSSRSRSSSSTSLSSTGSHSARDHSSSEPAAIIGLSSLTPLSAQSDFLSECLQSLERSFEEGHTVDNAAIELKTLRMASNVPLGQVRDVVIPFILKRCQAVTSVREVEELIGRWGGLISSLTGGERDERAQVDILLTTQRYLAEVGGSAGGEMKLWLRCLKGFYEEDIVSEEAVFGWYKSKEARSIGGAGGKLLWDAAKPFIEALNEESSEEEDESD